MTLLFQVDGTDCQHMGRWDAPSDESSRTAVDNCVDDNDSWVASLPPSFLKYDYQGRVIRVDVSPHALSGDVS